MHWNTWEGPPGERLLVWQRTWPCQRSHLDLVLLACRHGVVADRTHAQSAVVALVALVAVAAVELVPVPPSVLVAQALEVVADGAALPVAVAIRRALHCGPGTGETEPGGAGRAAIPGNALRSQAAPTKLYWQAHRPVERSQLPCQAAAA